MHHRILFGNYLLAIFEAFHIENHGSKLKILIKHKKTFAPLITIITDTEMIPTEEVHSLLAYHIPEELSEPTLVHLMHFLGF